MFKNMVRCSAECNTRLRIHLKILTRFFSQFCHNCTKPVPLCSRHDFLLIQKIKKKNFSCFADDLFVSVSRWRSATWRLDTMASRKKSRTCSSRLSPLLLAQRCCPSSPLPLALPRLPLTCHALQGPTRVSMVMKWILVMSSGPSKRSTGCRRRSGVWRQMSLIGGECPR